MNGNKDTDELHDPLTDPTASLAVLLERHMEARTANLPANKADWKKAVREKLRVSVKTIENWLNGKALPMEKGSGQGGWHDLMDVLHLGEPETGIGRARRHALERAREKARQRNGRKGRSQSGKTDISPTGDDTHSSDMPRGLVSLFDTPNPPALYANPPYLAGRGHFFGRAEQLNYIDKWADINTPQPVLLFEAIGGSGKSMLAWNWLTRRSPEIRQDWAGRFWYSFYESGASTNDFLTKALSYMTGDSRANLKEQPRQVLVEALFHHMNGQPWLIVLDGIERLLGKYQIFNVSSDPDEEAHINYEGALSNNYLDMAKDSDADLFRIFVGVTSSKILMTSRYLPKCMLGISCLPLEGLLHQRLPGLLPQDGELMLRSLGVNGDSKEIQSYLHEKFDGHPLVIGFLAGLINHHFPAPGDFDHWRASAIGGQALNLSSAKLVQRRTHILNSAIEVLSPTTHLVLSTLALLPCALKYDDLVQFVHRRVSAAEADNVVNRPEYSCPVPDISAKGDFGNKYWITDLEINKAIRDLEGRCLVLFNTTSKSIDVHPVVRRIVVDGMDKSILNAIGTQAVDYFSAESAVPFQKIRHMDQLQSRLIVVKTLLAMDRLEEAWLRMSDGLLTSLRLNMEDRGECTNLLRPLLSNNWVDIRESIDEHFHGSIWNSVGILLCPAGQYSRAIGAHITASKFDIGQEKWDGVVISLLCIFDALVRQSKIKRAHKVLAVAKDLANTLTDGCLIFMVGLSEVRMLRIVGRTEEATRLVDEIAQYGTDWSWHLYRPGELELARLKCAEESTGMDDGEFNSALKAASASACSRKVLRDLLRFRGVSMVDRHEYSPAVDLLRQAIELARAAGIRDIVAETCLIRARLGSGGLTADQALLAADRLAGETERDSLTLAKLFVQLAQHERAIAHAQAAYEEATADGEPYIRKRTADQAMAVITGNWGRLENCQDGIPAKIFDQQNREHPIVSLMNEKEELEDVNSQVLDLLLDSLLHGVKERTDGLKESRHQEIENFKKRSMDDRRVAARGHLVHKLKAKDSTGRWAYYFILIESSREEEFMNALKGAEIIDLVDYGTIVGSCYGESPTEALRQELFVKYGFSV